MNELLFADGFDEAIIGIGRQFSSQEFVAYDRAKCIEILMRDMTEDEAEEYFEFNVVGAWVGPGTPVFVEQMSKDEINDYADNYGAIEIGIGERIK